MTEQAKSIRLENTIPPKNAFYEAYLEQDHDGWHISYSNGRIGTPAKAPKRKTNAGLPYEKALKEFEKLVNSKIKTGYKAPENGAEVQGSGFDAELAARAGKETSYVRQGLTEIGLEDLKDLGPGWFVMEKYDGHHRGVVQENGEIQFANKLGLEATAVTHQRIRDAVAAFAQDLPENFHFTCEDMGDHLKIVDVPVHPAVSDATPFSKRNEILRALKQSIELKGGEYAEVLQVAEAVPLEQFVAEGGVERLRNAGAEGLVLLRGDSPYVRGLSKDALKLKFWKTCTVRVASQHGSKRSVGMELLDENDDWKGVGNLTIPASQEIPAIGSLVEVAYLYAYRGGALYQTSFKELRDDVREEDCKISQLWYKGETREEEPALVGMAM